MAKSNAATDSELATRDLIDPELAKAVQAAGIKDGAVYVPEESFAFPVTLESLCTIKWEKLPKALVSPPMVVKNVIEFPEGEKFDGYKGFVRCEAYLPDGAFVAWSTHLHNKSTGEKGPIAHYIAELPTPFAIRIGSFETSTPGRRVFRPVQLREP